MIRESIVGDLDYVYGLIHQTMINPGTITLGGSLTAHFLDCYSGIPQGSSYPTIDFNGSGNSAALRNFSGCVKMVNKTGSEVSVFGFSSGSARIDFTTVTAGTLFFTGVGKVVDDATDEWVESGTYGSLTVINEMTWGEHTAKVHAANSNKRQRNSSSGVITLYKADGTSVLVQFDSNSDLSEITPI